MNKLEKVYLKDIADTQTGPFGTQLHEKDYVNVGTPIVTVEHLGEIGFNKQNLPLVSDADKLRLSKIPNEHAKFVKEGFEELSTGLFMVKEVWARLNKDGFKCCVNNFWRLLRNPIYMGKIVIPAYKDEEEQLVDGKHEALITPELFYKVQDFLDGRRNNAPQKNFKRIQFPLRGLLICPQCGKYLTASSSKGNGGIYDYYHCKHGCKERVKAEIVNKRFTDVLLMISSNPAAIEYYEAEMKHKLIDNVHEKNKLVRKYQEEIDANKERINKARKMMLDDKIDADDYRETKDQYQPIIDKFIRKQVEVASMDSSCKLYGEFGFSVLKNLGKHYDNLDLEGKQQLVGLIFPEKLIFEKNQFRTKHLRKAVELICRKIKGFGGEKSGLAIKFDGQSTMVTPRGFEPPTNRTGICHSIQLNYGAKLCQR